MTMTPPLRRPTGSACPAPNSTPSAAVDLILILSAMVILPFGEIPSRATAGAQRRAALRVEGAEHARLGLAMNQDDPFNLGRFVEAQEDHYERALAELRDGRKQSHWMWFIFPQLLGLG